LVDDKKKRGKREKNGKKERIKIEKIKSN